MYFKKYKTSNLLFYLSILSLGYYLTLLKGYGSDGDTIGLIETFVTFIEKGIYSPSRGYGHPVAEIIIGFLSYNFGAVVSTYLSFLAFFISPFADNLTTALIMCAVVMAVGGDNKKFISIACVNIVVAANAGGRWRWI